MATSTPKNQMICRRNATSLNQEEPDSNSSSKSFQSSTVTSWGQDKVCILRHRALWNRKIHLGRHLTNYIKCWTAPPPT